MKPSELKRFNKLYHLHLRALKLQGMSDKTIDVYSRAVRRLSEHFDCVPDKVSSEQLATYFSLLIDSHSWSTVKTDRCGLQFFWKHVLKKDWKWVDLIKPPRVHSIPDVLSVAEVHLILQSTRSMRYRAFFLCTYSMGLRLSEALNLQVSDIDSDNLRVHVRRGKGHKDRFVPVSEPVIQQLRKLWLMHRHPKFIFPSTKSITNIQNAPITMSHGTTQYAFRTIVEQCGIKKKSPFTLCATVMPPTL